MTDAAEAIRAAHAFLLPRWRDRWHTVCAVVKTRSGTRHFALNGASHLPRAGVCCEPVAIGMAATADPDDPIVFCATVNRDGHVVPPCGVCRELLLDYAREAVIALPTEDGFRLASLDELIPCPYEGADRKPMASA